MKYFTISKKNTNGYAIIEIVIYIALFTMISIVLINSLLTAMKSFAEVESDHAIALSATTALERMSREIRGAESVDVGTSILNTNSGVLRINTYDTSNNSKTVTFDVSNNRIELIENGVVTDYITSTNTAVTNLIFRSITTTLGTAVKIELTIQSIHGRILSKNFYDTIVLRGVY